MGGQTNRVVVNLDMEGNPLAHIQITEYSKGMVAGNSYPIPHDLPGHTRSGAKQEHRGYLRIFIGYAAGVGVTHAMLEAALQRKKEGVDVVVGAAETHDRAETEYLLGDLEVIPFRQDDMEGRQAFDMDVEAVLKRNPTLVLVDELAHNNAPGARHPHRYQDIEELLEEGISVYSTLEIQNIESLSDVVSQITGIKVQETVPDSVVVEAADIELVDLPPGELMDRLKNGQVDVLDQDRGTIQNFYRMGNLTALRELTLRKVAARVDDQMRDYMRTQEIQGPWPAGERILVCISPGAISEKLIRTGKRLADDMRAEWTVIYVETPEQTPLSQDQRDRVRRAFLLAEELGAKTVSIPGQSIAETIIEYAHRHNDTKVIAGKEVHPRRIDFLKNSVTDRLIRMGGAIDVYVISSEREEKSEGKGGNLRPNRPWVRYLWGIILVAAATWLGILISSFISPTNLVVVYLLCVVLAALYLGRGPAVLVSFLSVLAFDFFLIPPHLTLAVADTEYILTFIGLLAVGLVISQLTSLVREQGEAAKYRETQSAALYDLGRDLATASKVEEVVKAGVEHLSQTFDRQVAVLLPTPDGLKTYSGNPELTIPNNEMAAARWSFQHGKPAGMGTGMLTSASIRYQPLKTTHGTVGVLGIKPTNADRFLTRDQIRTLEAFANQVALAIERASLSEQARQTELLEITDNLQNALLNSISHDLRTPLVTITGALSSLADDQVALNESNRRALIETASEEADRLNRLVGNLLDMTRLESSSMRIKRQAVDLQDLIGAVLEELKGRVEGRSVEVAVPYDLPPVMADFVLVERVLVNIIDNALKYSPPGTPIEVRAFLAGAFIEITVADRGEGIPPEDLKRVFDKFYRVQRPDKVSGTGLGLAISKGIIDAHGGFITAENRPGGGTLITIGLQVDMENG